MKMMAGGCTTRIVTRLFSEDSKSECPCKYKLKTPRDVCMQNYEDAIAALNGLQSNASILQRTRKENKAAEKSSLQQMESFLSRINLKVSDLDQLNIIHISGTKGKGSVAAFCESILRNSGFRTGFYSSPHLVEVRERIRINGRPLEREKFTNFFFECYDALTASSSDYNGDMPAYFRFLTLLAFHVFLQEKLDVVVMEVGIGGEYDCTNVIRNPTVCGITKLELDHTRILGNTIKEIAWHKAGIMKPSVPIITLPQVSEAEEVLLERAKEHKAYIKMAPTLSSYESEIGVAGKYQETNASLALQLCRVWLHRQKKYVLEKKGDSLPDGFMTLLNTCPSLQEGSKYIRPFKLPSSFVEGIKKTYWPGRCQVIKRNHMTFYIDGAHTLGSIESCADWVMSRQDKDLRVPRDQVFRVLVFNVTGGRDECSFLNIISDIGFDHAVFCPTILDSVPSDKSSDLTNFNVSTDTKLQTCEKNFKCWLNLQKDSNNLRTTLNSSNSILRHPPEESTNTASCFQSVSSAIRWVACGRDNDIAKADPVGPIVPTRLINAKHIQVVVTGSLHLVGTVMKFLGPNICEI